MQDTVIVTVTMNTPLIVEMIVILIFIGIVATAGVITALAIVRKKKVYAVASQINKFPLPRVSSELIPTDVPKPAWMTEQPYSQKIVHCISCGAVLNNYTGTTFCPYCGSKVQATPPRPSPVPRSTVQPLQEVPWLPPSAPLFVVNGVGIGLCALGGILSLLLGLGLPVIYPDVFQFGFAVVGFILMATVIVGGIITLAGVAIVKSRPKIGKIIIIIGALVSGINLITIFGIARLSKAKK